MVKIMFGRLRRHWAKAVFLLLAVVFTGFLWISPRATDQHESVHTSSTVFQVEVRSGSWQHPLCRCWRPVTRAVADIASSGESSCGPAADIRGPGQKVVSYSFYGDTTSSYFMGLTPNIETIDDLYDGWVVRLYHDIAPDDRRGTANLCRVVCSHPTLDDCYVGHLKIDGVTDGLLSKFGMLWRFTVMGDPLVDLFAVRDLDSPVYQREVDAVEDWIAEDTTFHIMRDNVYHNTEIMGGMWGGNNRRDPITLQRLRTELLAEPNLDFKSYDQELLADIVWPEARKNMTAHDSFQCGMFPGTKPWPTKRENRTFVGDMYGLSIAQECPPLCRPRDHQDWTFC